MVLLVTTKYTYIYGYEIVRRDRKLNGRLGGGVCIYIRNAINFNIRHDVFRLRININGNLFSYESYQPCIGRQVHLLKSSNTLSHFLVNLTQKILNSIF